VRWYKIKPEAMSKYPRTIEEEDTITSFRREII